MENVNLQHNSDEQQSRNDHALKKLQICPIFLIVYSGVKPKVTQPRKYSSNIDDSSKLGRD